MSGIQNVLQRHINAQGVISLDHYMNLCLTHPDFGYYVTRDPLGEAGDFTTSPEISQMFGEMIGVWAAILWERIGNQDVSLVELGPGRGTLMADLLRGTKNVRGFHSRITVHFVEKSPVLRQKQKEAIDALGIDIKVFWHDDISDIRTRDIVFVFANEFIDALPIKQLEFTEAGWMERCVGYKYPEGFSMGHTPAATALAELMPSEPGVGDVYEFSPARDDYIQRIIDFMEQKGGAALFIDYGHDEELAEGDTFQAVKDHEYVDAFEEPGTADLTSHVDFYKIREIAERNHCDVYGSVEQGDFLHKLGIGQRAEQLAKTDTAQAQTIYDAYKRLTDKDQMGELFRVMAITKKLDGEPLI